MEPVSNRVQLQAVISEREVLRYTPAGIPVVAARLLHRSQQLEAGMPRQIELEVAALAVGEISGRLNQAELGRAFSFSGFLARKSRNSRALVFHIDDFVAVGDEALSDTDLDTDTGAKHGIR